MKGIASGLDTDGRERKAERGRRREMEVASQSYTQLEVIVSPTVGPRGSFNLVHYLHDGTSQTIGRFTWEKTVKSGKDSYRHNT